MFYAVSYAPYQFKIRNKVCDGIRKCLRVMDGLGVAIAVTISELVIDVCCISTIKPIVHVKERNRTMKCFAQIVFVLQKISIIGRDKFTPITPVVVYTSGLHTGLNLPRLWIKDLSL